MKKIILLLVYITLSFSAFSQNASKLRPTMIVWQCVDTKYSLNDAKNGVVLNDSVALKIYFNSILYEKMTKNSNITLEFRWYYYLSTRKDLMYIDKIESKKFDRSMKNAIIAMSQKPNLTPGWWEVQVICSLDNGFLELANTNKFQILVNRK